MKWQTLLGALLLSVSSILLSGCGGPPAEEAAPPVSEAEIEENMKMGAVPNDGGG